MQANNILTIVTFMIHILKFFTLKTVTQKKIQYSETETCFNNVINNLAIYNTIPYYCFLIILHHN